MKKPDAIEGKPLVLNAAISERFTKEIKALMRVMHRDVAEGLAECFSTYGQDAKNSKGGSLVSPARILLNALLDKYNPAFTILAKKATARMIEQVNQNSATSLKMSLKDVSKDLTVKTDFMGERLHEITKSATEESVGLIKTIPQTYFNAVQKAVMNSISKDGKGIADLKRFLTPIYQGNERKAELVALDQTRKVYQRINSERMKQLGIKKFKWLHSGGGAVPRALHVELSGQIFSFDNPPEIGEMYGQKVHGLPGDLPNCGCRMSPVFDFEVDDEME